MSAPPEGSLPPRATFASRLGLLATMIGVAVGLGNVWRFPYMVGKFGGASFVLIYVSMVALLGIPALCAEWSLGRHTRRGPVGAFSRAGFAFGRQIGWVFFFGVAAATAYYTNVIGWVLYYGVGELVHLAGRPWEQQRILPPAHGFDALSFSLQLLATAVVILACVVVLRRGLRSGIEAVSKLVMPTLFFCLVVIIVRSVTLPGAWSGVQWYLLKFDLEALSPAAVAAALGQAVFSLSLGGTFMVVYGSYLGPAENLPRNALWTAAGDLGAGLLAGFAILPAVFALGLEPESGPGLIFATLPQVFAEIPFGGLFGLLFFASLFGAAYLSDVAAFEVMVAGLTDNTGLSRDRAVWTTAGTVFLLALVPMINMEIFVPWDLSFGSGMQIVGSLLAVVTVGWVLKRSAVLDELGPGSRRSSSWLLLWIRFVVPGAMVAVAVWWLLVDVLKIVPG
ncbi:MAG: sodium-dependent transporter [bacterium]|nr:sodium-dependent transporter [bacterium]